jgi:hypothetical protein
MVIRYNPATLAKIEKMIEESGYILRNERGTFQSGYCILEQKKVVVLNKFLQTEGRINTLLDIVPILNISAEQLTAENRKMYEEIISRLETEKE